MAAYVSLHSPARIVEWDKELIKAKSLRDWRGSFTDVTGEVVQVRMNMELKITEVYVHEALKNRIIEEARFCKKLNVIFPKDNWAPVDVEGKIMPQTIVDHYYGNKAKLLYRDKAPEFKTAALQEKPAITDKEWEALRIVVLEGRLLQQEKLQAEKLQAEMDFPRGHDKSCKGCDREHPKPDIEKMKKLMDLRKKFNEEHPEVAIEKKKMVMDLWRKFKGLKEV